MILIKQQSFINVSLIQHHLSSIQKGFILFYPVCSKRKLSLLLLTTTLKFSPRLGSTPAIAGLRSKEAGAANNLRVTAPRP